MTARHDAAVQAAFDSLEARFKAQVGPDDYRLRAVLNALARVAARSSSLPVDGRRGSGGWSKVCDTPARGWTSGESQTPLLTPERSPRTCEGIARFRPSMHLAGRRILDLGCGKGRFAAHVQRSGAEVVGLDISTRMLASANGLSRVRGSARRLPFAASVFDAVIAIEVLEHLSRRAIDEALAEILRVLRPSGVLVVVDKNAGALDARRPWLPSLALKWLDEHRGLWMYPRGGPVRERWFWPRSLRGRLGEWFEDVRVEHLLSPAEARGLLFRTLPGVRLMTVWTAHAPGGRDG